MNRKRGRAPFIYAEKTYNELKDNIVQALRKPWPRQQTRIMRIAINDCEKTFHSICITSTLLGFLTSGNVMTRIHQRRNCPFWRTDKQFHIHIWHPKHYAFDGALRNVLLFTNIIEHVVKYLIQT